MARHSLSDPARRDWCQWHRCRHPSDFIYYGAGICERHWQAVCAETDRPSGTERDHAMAYVAAKLGLNAEDLTKKPS